jgi:hypothetical protein
MANVLTSLAADIYKAADTVGREAVGFIPSVTINGDSSERVAKGGIVRAAFTRAAAAGDLTPSMTTPEGTDQTVDNKTLTISKMRGVQIPWTGEDIKHVNNGAGFSSIYGDQIAQAMRTLANEIEIDLGVAAYQGASRAFGTAGTTPFGTNFNDVASLRQILLDNGCAMDIGNLSLVMNSSAGTKLRQLATLTGVNTSGTDATLRRGELLNLQSFSLRESAGVATHTAGTATGFDANGGEPVGEETLVVDGSDSGTILLGDTVTWAGDTNKYVIQSATASGAATGNIVISEPGMREALATTVEGTLGAAYTANVGFHRSAIELAIRAPAVPEGGDTAVDAMMVQDPTSGLIFEIRVYKGYRKTMIEVAAAWGVKAWKSQNIAILLG